MSLRSLLAPAAAAALLATSAVAGTPVEYAPCPAGTQECLDYMVENLARRGWVGIELEDGPDKSMEVTAVVPGSPAETAGLRVGDLLVGVQGLRYATVTDEELAKVQKGMTPGSTVTFLVSRGGVEKEVPVLLAEMPERVRWQIIGHHMMSHAGRGTSGMVLPDELTPAQVAELVAADKITLCDANTPKVRREHGVVSGARLLTSSSSYDVATELPADKKSTLVFYCANPRCTASDAAAKRARAAGYTDVHVMRAGIMGWVEAGQPVDHPTGT